MRLACKATLEVALRMVYKLSGRDERLSHAGVREAVGKRLDDQRAWSTRARARKESVFAARVRQSQARR